MLIFKQLSQCVFAYYVDIFVGFFAYFQIDCPLLLSCAGIDMPVTG